MNRQCANMRCGKDFEVPSKAPRKKYCNSICSADDFRHDHEVPPERDCGHCGTRLERRIVTGGRNESYVLFARRKFCDRDCANASKRLHQDWELAEELDFLLGTDTPDAIAKRLGYGGVDSLFEVLRRNGQFDYLARVQRLHNEYLDAIREPAERGFWTG